MRLRNSSTRRLDSSVVGGSTAQLSIDSTSAQHATDESERNYVQCIVTREREAITARNKIFQVTSLVLYVNSVDAGAKFYGLKSRSIV